MEPRHDSYTVGWTIWDKFRCVRGGGVGQSPSSAQVFLYPPYRAKKPNNGTGYRVAHLSFSLRFFSLCVVCVYVLDENHWSKIAVFQQDLYLLLIIFFCANNFLLMKLLSTHYWPRAPTCEKTSKLQFLYNITKKVEFLDNGFRGKVRPFWRLASWGKAFLLK